MTFSSTLPTRRLRLSLDGSNTRCHSHKFDPISIRDYYRFQAFFVSGQPQNLLLDANDTTTRIAQERWRLFDGVQQRLTYVRRKQGHPEPILVTPSNVIAQMRSEERKQFNQLNEQLAQLDQTWGFYSPSTSATRLTVTPPEMRWQLPHSEAVLNRLRGAILIRGEIRDRGPEVDAGWPLVFGPAPGNAQTRKDLAY